MALPRAIWVASSAFDGMIEAFDVAYEVKDPRPLWKTRLLALGLAATGGCLLLSGLTIMILGPRFGVVVSFAKGPRTEVRLSYHANQGIDQGTSRSARAAAPPT